MRIQHNIMAMNAYRNYTNNVSAMKSNLEKLSSGYKINRAGDDAAGLAISEKMRAQITGLQQAQANAKSGINLVQTAEGALTEVHDMLNRMVKLADQSANGTYDDTTDRTQLQKEINQLLDEINRIADSANFNGIKLLDGSMDSTSSKTVGDATLLGLDKAVYNPHGEGYVNGQTPEDYVSGGDWDPGQGWGVYTHKDAVGDAKTSFEVRMSDTTVKGVKDAEGNATTTDVKLSILGKSGNAIVKVGDTAATEFIATEVQADENGVISDKAIAEALVKAAGGTEANGYVGTITLKNDENSVEVEYSVKAEGDVLKFEMTDKGYADASKAYKSVKGESTEAMSWGFDGNFNLKFEAGVEKKTALADKDAVLALAELQDADGKKVVKENPEEGKQVALATDNTYYDAEGNAYKITAGDGGKFDVEITRASVTTDGLKDNSTANINKGTAGGATQLADVIVGYFSQGPSLPPSIDEETKIPSGAGRTQIQDGSGLKIGNTSYVFAGTDDTFKGEYGDNVKVVDIRDIYSEKDKSLVDAKNAVNTALSRLTAAAADNEMFDVQLNGGGEWLTLREKEDYNGNGQDGRADLTTEKGINEQIQHFTGIKANVTTTAAKGKALTLQIGDTSDSFNQLKVNIADCHADALGIAGIDISNQDSAAAAVDKIRNAINKVSDVRGTLGATQNRLDHTINNLSVMTENIQDAESTIRDVDVAEEMMAYTKNNILIQSAQAMLAQANQVPQGVLQLLQ